MFVPLIFISANADWQYNITLNASQMPYISDITHTFAAPEGALLMIRDDVIDSRLRITWRNDMLANASNETTVVFLVVVNEQNITQNMSLYERFNISNTIDNATEYYAINISIIAPELPVINETFTNEISIINNDWQVNLTSNLLPFRGDFKYEIKGLPGAVLNISCNDSIILECPGQQRFDTDGYAKFTIKYHVPITQQDGNYTYDITLSSGNLTKVTRVYLTVTDPTIDMLSYVFQDSCFVPVEGQNYSAVKYDCIEEQEDFNLRRLAQFLERLKAMRNASLYCQPEVKTEYVVTGEVDKTIYDEYLVCKSERASLNTQVITSGEQLNSLQSSYSDLQERFNKNESETMIQAFAYRKNADLMVAREKSMYSKKYWTHTIWTMILIVSCVFGMLWYNHRKSTYWFGW
jgi:hypothetical protein